MSSAPEAHDVDALLTGADFFLQGIDIKHSQLIFVQTSRETLSRASFIDGRTPLSVGGPVIHVSVERALDWFKGQQVDSRSDRLIAHTAFCGSTLLARALDHKNYAFVYKEPQALIDLVTIKQGGYKFGATENDWPNIVKLCLLQYRKSWSVGEVSAVKPSNWVNILLPELLRYSDDLRLVLLSSSLREFLLAAIRGGRERFAYVLNFLNQLQIEFPQYASAIAGVESEGGSGLSGPLKYCAIAYFLQQKMFDRVQAEMCEAQNNSALRVSMQQLLEQPENCVQAVAWHLDLVLPRESSAELRSKVFGSHSKDPQQSFGADQAAAVASEIEALYSQELSQIIDWYNSHLAAGL